MQKILITGSSGYIGSSLCVFLEKKYIIKGLDKNSSNYFKFTRINLLNIQKLNQVLKSFKPDIVVHLAAQSLVDETVNKKKYLLNNIKVTKNLLLCLKKNKISNLIFSSTAAVYKYKDKALRK